jgi:asparagine synthase (glutamine-hydrolysing)
MQHSLEVRVPFLDHKVAELAMRIPIRFKLRNGETKKILKQAMEQYLPHGVLTHRKHGFSIPLQQWFKADLREYVHDRLLNSNSRLASYLDRNYVNAVVSDHGKGMRDLNGKIWTILFFDAWLEQQQS